MTNRERIQKRIERDKKRRAEKKAKRFSQMNDYSYVFDFERLWNAGIKCCNGVRWKASVQRWELTLLANISQLYDDLKSGKFQQHSGKFYCFDLYERGHLRHIRSLKINERTAQRTLCDNALVPVLESSFIYDNGATMKGKGITFAEHRLTKHIRQFINEYGIEEVLANGYVVQFDFRHYFDNASHNTLMKIVRKFFTDNWLVGTIRKFISDFGDVGLGLGSQISQILALALADKLDHVIKDCLRMKGGARYMDDGYVFCRTKEIAKTVLGAIHRVCKDLEIIVNEKKTRMVKLSRGFKFLKVIYNILPTGKIIRRTNHDGIKRQRQRLRAFRKKLDNGEIDIEHIEMSMESWLAHAKRANSYRTRMSMISRFHRLFPESKKFYKPAKFDKHEILRAAAFADNWCKRHKNPHTWWSRHHMKAAYENLKLNNPEAWLRLGQPQAA